MRIKPAQPKPPVHRQVKQQMLRRLGRDWTPGTRLPTVKKLAVQFKAGEHAVLQAVRELAAEGWLHSRQRRGTVVLPRPSNPQARSWPYSALAGIDPQPLPLANKIINLIATFPMPDGMIFEIIQGFTNALEPTGAILRTFANQATPLRTTTMNFAPCGGDAVCVINHPPKVPLVCDPSQKLLLISTVPDLRVESVHGHDLVSVDHQQGAALAGRRLRELGCADACFLGMSSAPLKPGLSTRSPGFFPPESASLFDRVSADRLQGFENGWGAKLAPNHLIPCRYYDYPSGAQAVPLFMALRPRPQGVFAATDELAIGFITGAAAHGLRPGADFQIIGFDGQVAGRTLNDGQLSSIDVHPTLLGQTGAQLLIERFTEPDHLPRRILLACSLIAGDTAQTNGTGTFF